MHFCACSEKRVRQFSCSLQYEILKTSALVNDTISLYDNTFSDFTESIQSSEVMARRIKGAQFEQFYLYQEVRNKLFTRVQIRCIIQGDQKVSVHMMIAVHKTS
jgi:hypothetical protein